MRGLAATLIVMSALSSPAFAQERDRSLERINLALQQPPAMHLFEPLPKAPKLGPFTLETPLLRGEFIRISLPVGEYVMRTARAISSAKRRRQEAAARRMVEAELKAFIKQGPAQ